MAHDTGDADIGDVHYEVPLEGRQIGGRDLRSKTDPLGRDIDNFLRNLFGGEEVGRQPTPNLGVLPQAPTRGVNGDVRINDVNRIRAALNIPVPPIANELNLTDEVVAPISSTFTGDEQTPAQTPVGASRGGPRKLLVPPTPPTSTNVAATTNAAQQQAPVVAPPVTTENQAARLADPSQQISGPGSPGARSAADLLNTYGLGTGAAEDTSATPIPPSLPTAARVSPANVVTPPVPETLMEPRPPGDPTTAPISAAEILPTTDQIPAAPDTTQALVEAGTPNTPVGTVASPEASEDINIKRSVPIGEGEQGGQSPTSAGRLISQFGEGLVRELSKLAPDVSALIPGGPLLSRLSQALPGKGTAVGLSDLLKGESGSAEANVPSGAPTAPGVSDNILDNFDDEFYTAPRTAPPLPTGREDELAAIRGRRGTPDIAPALPGSASDIATAAFAAPDAPGAFDPETGIATLDPNDTDGIIALANSLADASEAQRAGVLNSLDQETKIAVLARLDEMDQITQAGGDID
jgi:hypothetical protein